MKSVCIALVTILLTVGCNQSGGESNTLEDKGRSHSSPSPTQFDAAIETIATSTDMDAVHAAADALRSGGLPAIRALRGHLSDKRIPPSDYLTRAVSGTPDMSDHCFWLIQDMIEPGVPKLYREAYAVLTRDNVEQWLDDRGGKSIVELQIDAAAASLDRAERDFDTSGESHAKEAFHIYSERLSELRTDTN